VEIKAVVAFMNAQDSKMAGYTAAVLPFIDT
jgi:hypothetical protein